MHREIERLVKQQGGLIMRAQLLELGESPGGIRRRLRRRDLVRVMPGIYVNHTGRLTWEQRAWAAVLSAWPAALWGESVWRQTDPIHVAVARGRSVAPVRGVVHHHVADLDDRVWWLENPPRMKVEHAALVAAAAAADDFAAISVLAEVVQRRRTTYAALTAALKSRRRTRRGSWLHRVLADLALGADSVLEHGYLTKVERAHGLPVGKRQVSGRVAGKVVVRDVDYDEYGLLVELDGRLFHDNAQARDADLMRDLAAAVVESKRTARVGWGQVFKDACRTAVLLAGLLAKGGWAGDFVRCPHCPR